MKGLYKTIAAAVASAAIGLGIGYEIGDSHGYERAPTDMQPAEYMHKRFDSMRIKAIEQTPKTDKELLEWFKNFESRNQGK